MKLRNIYEDVADEIGDSLDSQNLLNKQSIATPENAIGVDAGENNAGDIKSPGGVPTKLRHQVYMGITK